MKEKIIDALLEATETVLGLPKAEMKDNLDMDLFENGLIDSIGCTSVIAEVEGILGKSVSIDAMEPDDFVSLSAMASAIERII